MKEKKVKKQEDKIQEEMPDNEQTGKSEVSDDTSVKIETEAAQPVNDELLKKIEVLENEKKELHDRLLRRIAEFENYKRRTENEQITLIKFAAEHFIVDILPIYDDLERSLSHVNDENKDSLIKGLKMVFEKFGKILESHGVKRIDAKGKEFDFNYHEALMRQETNEYPPDTVINVFDNGYLYKDKVIKHAKVIVSAAAQTKDDDVKESSDQNEKEISQE